MKIEELHFLNKLTDFWENFLHYSKMLLNLNVLTLDSNNIKISNIVITIFVFIIGNYFLNISRKSLLLHVSKNIENDKNAISLVRKFYTYSYILIFIAILLQTANIPMKTFAFIGGAFALSVGYGAQNVISNILSGLILIFEKTIKIGDYIKLDTISGTVESIGARCTVISSEEGSNFLIPNNEMVQKHIQNFGQNSQNLKLNIDIKFNKKNSNFDLNIISENIAKITKILENDYKMIQSEFSLKKITLTQNIFSYDLKFSEKEKLKILDLKNKINLELLKSFENFEFEIEYL